jgi:hypothetical protein
MPSPNGSNATAPRTAPAGSCTKTTPPIAWINAASPPPHSAAIRSRAFRQQQLGGTSSASSAVPNNFKFYKPVPNAVYKPVPYFPPSPPYFPSIAPSTSPARTTRRWSLPRHTKKPSVDRGLLKIFDCRVPAGVTLRSLRSSASGSQPIHTRRSECHPA